MNENTPQHTTDDGQSMLFDVAEFRPDRPEPEESPPGTPRMKVPDRRQVQFVAAAWDDLLPEGHQARIVWDFVQGLDLTPLHQKIKAVERRPGASAIAPGILMALWLYATLRGIGSARELNRRCGEQGEVPFRWICGGVSVNYHTLSDFRTAHGDFLDSVLTQSVASLLEQDLVDMDRVAHDGMRVRASAGSSSFRRKKTLEECLDEAKAQVEALKAELEHDPTAANRRQQAAQQRAADDRVKRVQEALSQMPDLEAKKKSEKDKSRDPHEPLPDDAPAVAAWRKRMGTDEAKEIYKDRAATAECVNAIARNRGLQQFAVRGVQKVKAVVLWYVLAHNLIRAEALRASRENLC